MPERLKKPRFRPGLFITAQSLDYILEDQLRLSPTITLNALSFEFIRLFNGQRTLHEIHFQVTQNRSGYPSIEDLARLVSELDDCLYLDSRKFQELIFGPVRKPSCIGCYSEDPKIIASELNRLFTADGGPGLPGEWGSRVARDGEIQGLLVPHMDYGRGGTVYGWGYKELVERSRARLFLIIATSHYSGERFTLTRQNFATPLGVVETDQKLIDRLVELYGEGLFNDPIAHLPEHSIELEVLLLQHLIPEPIRIVPLLVGSYADCIEAGSTPESADDIQRMVRSLRKLAAEIQEPFCTIISGDLAHIGPKFDDPEPVNETVLAASRLQDRRILEAAEKADAQAYYRVIQQEQDRRRICGLPPTSLFLSALTTRARPAFEIRSICASGRIRKRQLRRHGLSFS